MNEQRYLQIGSDVLPINKNDYTIAYSDIEADRTTEAGTTSREIVREGRKTINTNFTVTQPWISKLRAFKASASLNVIYYDPGTAATSSATMWVSSFSESLLMDSATTPVFAINMTLEEY